MSPGPLRCPLRWRDGAMERCGCCGCCGCMLHDDTMTQKPQKPQKLHTSRVLVTVKSCLHSVPNTVGPFFRCSVRADNLPSLFLLALGSQNRSLTGQSIDLCPLPIRSSCHSYTLIHTSVVRWSSVVYYKSSKTRHTPR